MAETDEMTVGVNWGGSDFDLELIPEFLDAFVNNARITLHLKIMEGKNKHHMIESCFKALGVLLGQAAKIDQNKNKIPSTKGVL